MSCTKDHKEGVDPKKKGPLGKLKESLDDKVRPDISPGQQKHADRQ